MATGEVRVPVREAVLGRVMDILGAAVDGLGDLKKSGEAPIFREAVSYSELVAEATVWETGIKVIDLFAPLVRGERWDYLEERGWVRHCC